MVGFCQGKREGKMNGWTETDLNGRPPARVRECEGGRTETDLNGRLLPRKEGWPGGRGRIN